MLSHAQVCGGVGDRLALAVEAHAEADAFTSFLCQGDVDLGPLLGAKGGEGREVQVPMARKSGKSAGRVTLHVTFV